MTTITTEQLVSISGAKRPTKAMLSNIESIITALSTYGKSPGGLDMPHRLAHFIAQLAHESGGFRYDAEIWGPTPAQTRYDTRTDLGNSKEVDGDGELYKGRGPIQVTGGSNYRRFRDWCRLNGIMSPDFAAEPDKLNEDPWEGLSAIWYWSAGNPTGKSLNVYADENNIQQITKKINGGLNGFADRVRFYVRSGLVLLDFDPEDVVGFQRHAQENGWLEAGTNNVDGDPGPKTMAAIHKALAASAGAERNVKVSPVTEVVTKTEHVPTPIVPKGATKRGWNWMLAVPGILGAPITWFFSLDRVSQMTFGTVTALLFILILWRGEWLIARTKELLAEVDK